MSTRRHPSSTRRKSARGHTPARHAPFRPIDRLEPRTLLASDPLLTGVLGVDALAPTALTYANNGALWFAAPNPSTGQPELLLVGAGNTLTATGVTFAEGTIDLLAAGPGASVVFTHRTTVESAEVTQLYQYTPGTTTPLAALHTFSATVPLRGLTVNGSEIWSLREAAPNGEFSWENGIEYYNLATGVSDWVVTSVDHPELAMSTAVGLSPGKTGGVWHGAYVAFTAFDGTLSSGAGAPVGQSAVGYATFDPAAGIQLKLADPSPGTYMDVSSIATAPDGSFWLATGPGEDISYIPDRPAHRLLHGAFAGALNDYAELGAYALPGAVDNVSLGLRSLAFDYANRLWFVESRNFTVGYLDTATLNSPSGPAFGMTSPLPATDAVTAPWIVVASPVAPPTPEDPSAAILASGDYSWVSAALPPFGAAGLTATPVEDKLYENIPLAWFNAPAGDYQAIIHWGDGSAPEVVFVADNGTTLHVVTTSKRWSGQSPAGGFQGTVEIRQLDGTPIGDVLTFSYAVTDTPIMLGTLSVTPIFARIAVVSVSFTDDVDASASWYDADISWGDGSTSDGLIVRDPFTGRFYIVGIHQYKKRATYTVSVTLTTTESGALAGTPLTTSAVVRV